MESFKQVNEATEVVIRALQGLDADQRALVLENAMVSLKMRGSVAGSSLLSEGSPSRGRGGRGGRGGRTPPPVSAPSGEKAKTANAENQRPKPASLDLLKEVSGRLKPLIGVLPQVERQANASVPSMDSKSVRSRLYQRRSALHKVLLELCKSERIEDRVPILYRFINSVQSFRIAGRDALSVKVGLPTSPFLGVDGAKLDTIMEQTVAYVGAITSDQIAGLRFLGNGFLPEDRISRAAHAAPPCGGGGGAEAAAQRGSGSAAGAGAGSDDSEQLF